MIIEMCKGFKILNIFIKFLSSMIFSCLWRWLWCEKALSIAYNCRVSLQHVFFYTLEDDSNMQRLYRSESIHKVSLQYVYPIQYLVITVICIGLTTLLTVTGFHSSMNTFMIMKATDMSKGFTILNTFMRFLSRMIHCMSLRITVMQKGFITLMAFGGFCSSIYSFL